MQHIHTQEDGISEATPTATPTSFSAAPASTEELVAKVKTLEKDLYYYRKTSRDLRRKLQSVSSVDRTARGSNRSTGVGGAEEGVNSAPEMEGGKVAGHTKVKSKRRKDVGIGGKELTVGAGGGGELAGHKHGETGGEDADIGVVDGGNLAGVECKGDAPPARKDKQIQAAVSILRGGREQSPSKIRGTTGMRDPLKPTDGVKGPQVTGITGQAMRHQPMLPQQQPVVVKRSWKELRQLR